MHNELICEPRNLAAPRGGNDAAISKATPFEKTKLVCHPIQKPGPPSPPGERDSRLVVISVKDMIEREF
jgi:hypothetical protein